ncbi:MAG TPA: molybdopterin molybdotransferase MoeA [Cyclobacteriaceae bacterium]|nr:molybdopterin molybdotransferase MoeA [Cyclobacteriaceae bacterium]
MITVQQASSIIGEVPFRAATEKILLEHATGHVLAEKVIADRDLPPFHRATMDGIAIAFDEYSVGRREFNVEGVLAAGQPQSTLTSKSGCFEIMTGATLPAGTDTVVRYEDVTISNGKATITANVEKNQSVHFKGIDAIADQVLLYPGTVILPAEVAVLASVGKSEVLVYKVKPIAIVSTGDELVPVNATPEPWQIRRSNGIALSSALKTLKIESNIFHLPDEPATLERELRSIVNDHDVVILSGGVSKGKFDYVPGILEKLGIRKAFHQVKQRPGKPLWFGRSDSKTVFALPGNPVSTFLCFHRYIKPWIEAGLAIKPGNENVVLATDFTFKPDLTYFLQVKIDTTNGQLSATPDPGEGSGDFANLRNVDGFIELPSDRSEFKKGGVFPFIGFRRG